MTKLRIDWDYDPEDETALKLDLDTDEGGRFFVAWLNPATEAIEWTCTDAEYPGGPYFEELAEMMSGETDQP